MRRKKAAQRQALGVQMECLEPLSQGCLVILMNSNRERGKDTGWRHEKEHNARGSPEMVWIE